MELTRKGEATPVVELELVRPACGHAGSSVALLLVMLFIASIEVAEREGSTASGGNFRLRSGTGDVVLLFLEFLPNLLQISTFVFFCRMHIVICWHPKFTGLRKINHVNP
jgi:hypothetical protein